MQWRLLEGIGELFAKTQWNSETLKQTSTWLYERFVFIRLVAHAAFSRARRNNRNVDWVSSRVTLVWASTRGETPKVIVQERPLKAWKGEKLQHAWYSGYTCRFQSRRCSLTQHLSIEIKHSLEEKEVNTFPTHHLPYLARTPLSTLSAADALNDFFSPLPPLSPPPRHLKRLKFLQLCQSGAVRWPKP